MNATQSTQRLMLDDLAGINDAPGLLLVTEEPGSIHYRALGPLGDAATEARVPSELLPSLRALREQRRRQEDEAYRRSEDVSADDIDWPWDDEIDYVSGSWFGADGELKEGWIR